MIGATVELKLSRCQERGGKPGCHQSWREHDRALPLPAQGGPGANEHESQSTVPSSSAAVRCRGPCPSAGRGHSVSREPVHEHERSVHLALFVSGWIQDRQRPSALKAQGFRDQSCTTARADFRKPWMDAAKVGPEG